MQPNTIEMQSKTIKMQPNAIEMQSKTTITMGHRFIGIEGKSQKLQPRMIEMHPSGGSMNVRKEPSVSNRTNAAKCRLFFEKDRIEMHSKIV